MKWKAINKHKNDNVFLCSALSINCDACLKFSLFYVCEMDTQWSLLNIFLAIFKSNVIHTTLQSDHFDIHRPPFGFSENISNLLTILGSWHIIK